MNTNRPANDPVVQAAIEWMVLLRSGAATEDDAREFNIWRNVDDRHEAACKRIEQTLGIFGNLSGAHVPPEAARRALAAPSARRRRVTRALGLGAVAVVSGYFIQRTPQYRETFADIRTSVGQRHPQDLPDGTHLLLNARTSINIGSLAGGSELQLLAGEVLVTAAHDRGATAGVTISTREARFAALGRGAFSVRQNERRSRINVLEGDVQVVLSGTLHSAALTAGQTADVSAFGTQIQQDRSPYAESAWTAGKLQVNDRALAEVVSALSDYRPGYIRLSPSAADLRVSGVFPLDDSEYTLAALAQTLPIVVRKLGAVWVSIDTA